MAGALEKNVLAVDIGAGSGRFILGTFRNGDLRLAETGRFVHRDCRVNGLIYWNLPEIYNHVLEGIRKATEIAGHLDGVGFDTFAPDFACFTDAGLLAGNILSYRNFQGPGPLEPMLAQLSTDDFWEICGNEPLAFSWLPQLLHLQSLGLFAPSAGITPLPLGNALAYLLSGVRHTDWTQVSISMMSDRRLKNWSPELIERFIRPPFHLPDMLPCGNVLDNMRVNGALADTAVINVGSHDTACANGFLALRSGAELVVNAGTWISVGTVCDEPVVNRAMMDHALNNYGLPDGRTLVCRLSIGMGLIRTLYGCMVEEGYAPDYATLGSLASSSDYDQYFDVHDPDLFATDRPFPRVVADILAREDKPAPDGFLDVVRSVYLSLAENIAAVGDALEQST